MRLARDGGRAIGGRRRCLEREREREVELLVVVCCLW